MIFPGQTIGILGGGQLGRMMILEGRKMGYRFIVLDPTPDCPASQVADEQIIGHYDDTEAAKSLAKKSDLILYEFENIDPDLVKELEKMTSVPQGSHLLEVTQHRLREKQAIEQADVPVTPYLTINQKSDIIDGVTTWRKSAILKTAMGGYDGKGQWFIHSKQDAEQLPDTLFSSANPYILEQFVPFEKEISVVVARRRSGEVKVFPPTLNIHRNHILHMSIAPAPLDPKLTNLVKQTGKQIAEKLNVVGLIAIEMFLLVDGRLLVNETAPRPHNSGHYTYDSCQTSQFEQIFRATIDLPLHSTEMKVPSAVMVNVLGEHQKALMDQWEHFPQNAKTHWYGKKEGKTGRKMGHITFLGHSISQLIGDIEQIPIWERLTSQEKVTIFGEEEIENYD